MLQVGVAVSGTKFNNRGPFEEDTFTVVVNAHGALVQFDEPVLLAQKLMIRNKTTGETRECKVVDIGSDERGRTSVGIEFSEPAPRFWRISFPPEDWTSRSPEAKTYTKGKPAYPASPVPAKPVAK